MYLLYLNPTIKRNIYLDLLYCRRLQYVNRNRLRKIGQEQAKEARVCRDKRLNKIKEVINQIDKISKWCNKSKARNNLEQFFGVQRVKQSQNNVRCNLLARNLFQSLQRRTEILEDNLRVTALKGKLNKERFRKYKKHCTSNHNNKN